MIHKIKYLSIAVVFALFLASCAKIMSENEEDVLGAFFDRENWLKKIEKDPMKSYSFYKEEDLNIIYRPSTEAEYNELLNRSGGVYTDTGFYIDARADWVSGRVKFFDLESSPRIFDFQIELKLDPIFGGNFDKNLLIFLSGRISYYIEINDNGDDKSVFLLRDYLSNTILFSQEIPYKNEEMLITIRKKGNQISFFCNKKWIESIGCDFNYIRGMGLSVYKGNQVTIKDFCVANFKK